MRYQGYPESASVLPKGTWSFNGTADWSAHLAKTDQYLFDGESVTSTVKLRHTPLQDWEFGLDIPWTVRVDGILDRFIEFVETSLNAKVLARYNLPRDLYQAFVTDGKKPTLLMTRAMGMNDITLRAKHQFFHQEQAGINASFGMTLSLPSGDETFGGQGFSPGAGLHLERQFTCDYTLLKGINLMAGGTGNYYSDSREQLFLFNHWRGMGYAGAEIKFHRRVALVCMYQVYSAFASNYSPLTVAAHYYSFTGRFWIRPKTILEIGVVENLGLIENRNSSDVTFKFSITHRF